ncbi:MAG: response regulator [Verrucomicrobia bacterium]|nr:response regulator [Verrucomicrobiota bacterium]
MRLLIVDDSQTMRSILASYADHLGFETCQAPDGLAALALLEKDSDFDAVLIDWDMPNLNGLGLLKAIRANPEFDGLKTMMVTAQSGYEHLSEAIHCGADDYLMKPLDEPMFGEKLRVLGLVA